MSNIYEWLFDHYALPKLQIIEPDHNDAIDAFSGHVKLSETEHLRLLDMVSNMRLEWGIAAFALGVKFGLRLHAPRTRFGKPGWLMHFLP